METGPAVQRPSGTGNRVLNQPTHLVQNAVWAGIPFFMLVSRISTLGLFKGPRYSHRTGKLPPCPPSVGVVASLDGSHR